MNWFAWRQHRKQFLIMAILVVLYAALVIPTGLHFWHTYQQTLANCAKNPATPSCSDIGSNLFQSSIDQLLFRMIPLATVLMPVLFGMFWGAPFMAKEYADGTNNLAWTQSVSRRKWLSIKMLWIYGATIILMGAFAALCTWWSNTPNTLNDNRFGGNLFFDSQGIVPIAYGIFAVAYGILFGAWFRKLMIAVGLTLGLFIVVAMIVIPNFARTHYMTPVTVTSQMGPDAIDAKVPTDAWVTSRDILDKNGHRFNSFDLTDMPPQCQQIIQQSQVSGDHHAVRIKAAVGGADPIDACLNQAGYHQVATYQPSYRYWDFQRIEAGIYVALSAIAVGATYWVVLKRDA